MAHRTLGEHLSPFAFETLTYSNAAASCTASTCINAVGAVITTEGGASRYRVDGTDPTATTGHVVAINSSLVLGCPQEVNQARFIGDASSSVSAMVTYYR